MAETRHDWLKRYTENVQAAEKKHADEMLNMQTDEELLEQCKPFIDGTGVGLRKALDAGQIVNRYDCKVFKGTALYVLWVRNPTVIRKYVEETWKLQCNTFEADGVLGFRMYFQVHV